MGIQITETKSLPEQNNVLLDVAQSGGSIVVSPGDFVIAGVSYNLSEEQTFVATNRPEKASVAGVLALDTSNDKVVLIVDELVEDSDDGWDEAFDWTGSQYERLHMIWLLSRVPENTATLDDVKLEVFHIVELSSGE